MKNFLETEHNVSVYNFHDVLSLHLNNADKLSGKILATCYFHESDFPLYMHAHSFYEINIVTSGEGLHYIGKNRIPAKSGDVFVIPPNFKHGYEDLKDLVIFHIVLSNEFFEKYNTFLKDIYGFSLLFNIEPALRTKTSSSVFPSIPPSDFLHHMNEMYKLDALCKEDGVGPLQEGTKCLKILNLLADFAKVMTANEIKSNQNIFIDTPSILKVITYIESNYHTNVTIQDLCRISSMSRSSLLKQFAELCKYSPTDYLLRIRIEKACELLKNSNHSIARIAQDCGFYDSSHFSKTFLKLQNVSPKEYRKQFR